MQSLDRIEAKLKDQGFAIEAKRDHEFMAQCPAHNDGRPSLHVTSKSGKTMLHCFAGCESSAITAALGMEISDLFDEPLEDKRKSNSRPEVVATYQYENANGDPLYQVVRYEPKRFIQQRWDPRAKRFISGMDGVTRVPYRLPQILDAARRGQDIWIVEGEKDVHAMERMGAVATCNPGGALKWQQGYSDKLSKVVTSDSSIRVVVDQDIPKPGEIPVGTRHASMVASAFGKLGIKVHLYKPKEGKDAHDHWAAGGTLADFIEYTPEGLEPDAPVQARPKGIKGDVLQKKVFEPIQWVIQDLMPAGLAILASPPKIGKSWVALSMALAVASGGRAMGRLQGVQGDVLYLAMEDNERRLQDRIDVLLQDEPDPKAFDLSRIEFQTVESQWPGGIEGRALLEEWANSVPNPRLVILDTLAKVDPGEEGGSQNAYHKDYALTAAYKQFSDRYNLCTLFVHHDRKGGDNGGDWLKSISGSQGLTGGADTIMFLQAVRGEREGFLMVTGKDVEDMELSIRKPLHRPYWDIDSAPTSSPGTGEVMSKLIDFIYDRKGGVSRQEILAHFNAGPEASKRFDTYLHRLVSSGKVVRAGRGLYARTDE